MMATGAITPTKSPPKPSPQLTTTTVTVTTTTTTTTVATPPPHYTHHPLPPPQSSPNPTTPAATPTLPSKETTTTPASVAATPRLPDPPSSDADVIHIPSYSRWFSWNNIHECEVRHLPEFFDGRSPSRNPKVYKYYRNTIIRRFRDNPLPLPKKITFTDIRKTIIGDVGSIRRVFDFLETWGLINYSGSAVSKPQSKWEEKETKANAAAAAAAASLASSDASGANVAADAAVSKKRLCNGCKNVCSISCFSSEKYDLTLCARCFVRQNYRVGVNSSDFKRVEISEEVSTDWTEKEILHLLEAVMHYGDDWKKVAEHVGGGRSDKECVARFIKLPFGEQFIGPPESATQVDDEDGVGPQAPLPPAKRKRLSPLTDASNPIMAQAAFLSALAGVEVSEVAAHAALIALSDLNSGKVKETFKVLSGGAKQGSDNVASNGDTTTTMDDAFAKARLQLEKEEDELEKAVSAIAVRTKEIEDKIVHFEEFELETEKRWQQLQQLQNLLFADQLKLILNKTAPAKAEDSLEEIVKVE